MLVGKFLALARKNSQTTSSKHGRSVEVGPEHIGAAHRGIADAVLDQALVAVLAQRSPEEPEVAVVDPVASGGQLEAEAGA